MLTLSLFGAVIALCFWGLSYLLTGLWPYYAPATLAATVLWLHLIDHRNRQIVWRLVESVPDMFFAEERRMLLASPSLLISAVRPVRWVERHEWISVIVAIDVVAFVGAAGSAILLAWAPLALFVLLLLYGLLGPLAAALPTRDPEEDKGQAIDRYRHRLHGRCRRHRYSRSQSVWAAEAHYESVLAKLQSVPELLVAGGVSEDTTKRDRAEILARIGAAKPSIAGHGRTAADG